MIFNSYFNFKLSEFIGGFDQYIRGVIDCNEWKIEMSRMHKYGESETTRIVTATVHHVTSSSGLIKFQAAWFSLNRGYKSAKRGLRLEDLYPYLFSPLHLQLTNNALQIQSLFRTLLLFQLSPLLHNWHKQLNHYDCSVS